MPDIEFPSTPSPRPLAPPRRAPPPSLLMNPRLRQPPRTLPQTSCSPRPPPIRDSLQRVSSPPLPRSPRKHQPRGAGGAKRLIRRVAKRDLDVRVQTLQSRLIAPNGDPSACSRVARGLQGHLSGVPGCPNQPAPFRLLPSFAWRESAIHEARPASSASWGLHPEAMRVSSVNGDARRLWVSGRRPAWERCAGGRRGSVAPEAHQRRQPATAGSAGSGDPCQQRVLTDRLSTQGRLGGHQTGGTARDYRRRGYRTVTVNTCMPSAGCRRVERLRHSLCMARGRRYGRSPASTSRALAEFWHGRASTGCRQEPSRRRAGPPPKGARGGAGGSTRPSRGLGEGR